MTDILRISEIFGPTIQGEGALIGKPTIFVRTGGCDYRCAWCDTLHAVESAYRDEWLPMSAADVFAKVEELSGGQPLMISLSGGNPAIQNLKPLILMGKDKGYRFTLETQGSIAQDWFSDLDMLVLSPKPPSSNMQTDFPALEKCMAAAGDPAKLILKIVIFDDADYHYAQGIASKYPHLPLYLQPGNTAPLGVDLNTDALMARLRWLVERVNTDRWFSVTVLPQLHVMLWGNVRGV